MATSDSKQGGFTVNDRRSFAGSEASSASKPAAPSPPAEAGAGHDADHDHDHDHDIRPGTAERASAAGAFDQQSAHDASSLPAVDFHTFILSLGSSALLHLGELEHPDGGEVEKDLPLAKHTIDILSMLQDKTRGNLTDAEDKLIDSLLYDLRLRYVNATK
jgi:hypothetical protein